ncbi:nitrate transporter 1.2, partial [Genlisea aurea]
DQKQANETPSQDLRFLNKAITDHPCFDILKCSVQELEDVKMVIRILPMFASTVMLYVCLAQLSTFSVQQAAAMNTNLVPLKVPPASLPIFPVVFIMILAPSYDRVVIPLARRVRNNETGIEYLEKIGFGLVLSILAMGAAAQIEIRRKRGASESRSMSFLWIGVQYLFLGSADLFSLAGLLEFFFTEAPLRMRSLATALSWTSLAVGYYLSAAIVWVVNRITGGSGQDPWLSGRNLNRYRLDRFYWLLCLLSVLNLVNYVLWAAK